MQSKTKKRFKLQQREERDGTASRVVVVSPVPSTSFPESGPFLLPPIQLGGGQFLQSLDIIEARSLCAMTVIKEKEGQSLYKLWNQLPRIARPIMRKTIACPLAP